MTENGPLSSQIWIIPDEDAQGPVLSHYRSLFRPCQVHRHASLPSALSLIHI